MTVDELGLVFGFFVGLVVGMCIMWLIVMTIGLGIYA